jgi:murein DD-endopeptidase MepM/ murein hydrolase activator NlpD
LFKTALFMPGKFLFALLCLLALVRQAHAQEVIIAREASPHFPRAEAVSKSQAKTEVHFEKAIAVQPTKPQAPENKVLPATPAIGQVGKGQPVTPQPYKPEAPGGQTIKAPTASTWSAKAAVAVVKPPNATTKAATHSQQPKGEASVSEATKVSTAITPSSKPIVAVPVSTTNKERATPSQPFKAEVRSDQPVRTASAILPVQKQETNTTSSLDAQDHSLAAISVQPVNNHFETAFNKLADGFDFPIGKPDAQGYYKARGFRSHGHLGEDWDGVRGGDTDLGDPIYSMGDGLVVFARDCHMGWGNVIIIRHSYRESGAVKNIDALYGHLNTMLVHRGQAVARGQKIATMGTAHGLYDAHLHLEIRKNIEIGMSRAAFAKDFSNYYDPSQFILTHRHLSTSGGTYRVAMNTFVRDAHINFNKARNYSHSRSRGGTRESATALKKAIASQQ